MTAEPAPPAATAEPGELSLPHEPAGALHRIDARQVELLRSLLTEYPDDAAAVYFGFDREHRCSPDFVDRLARVCGLEAAWQAANRATLRALLDQQRGNLHRVAELLGRDTDSLQALLGRVRLRDWVEGVRQRERARWGRAALGERVVFLLQRERVAEDLGVLDALNARVLADLRQRCAELSGGADDAETVLDRIAGECGLDAAQAERMQRRWDLRRFVADLYQTPVDDERAAPRRLDRPASGLRPPLDAAEIEMRILRMLLAKGKVGASHTHIDHLVRTVPRHERGRARTIVDRLLAEGTLVRKVTDNSAEPHVSLAVAAVPQVDARLRTAAQRAVGADAPAVVPANGPASKPAGAGDSPAASVQTVAAADE